MERLSRSFQVPTALPDRHIIHTVLLAGRSTSRLPASVQHEREECKVDRLSSAIGLRESCAKHGSAVAKLKARLYRIPLLLIFKRTI